MSINFKLAYNLLSHIRIYNLLLREKWQTTADRKMNTKTKQIDILLFALKKERNMSENILETLGRFLY